MVLGAVIAATGCAPSASSGTFESDNPASRLYAIHRAGLDADASAVVPLVEQLESDDPAIRMMAINALERITGKRLGYNPYADRTERHEAIDRWIEAVRKGQI